MSKKIDMTDQIMQRIADEQIVMRPRSRFAIERAAKRISLLLLALLFVLSTSAVVYSVGNSLFNDYLSYGDRGLGEALKTVPWVALGVVGLLATAAVVKSLHSAHKLRFALAPGLAAILFLVGLGSVMSLPLATDGVASRIATVFRDGSEPIKLVGQVKRINDTSLVLKLGDGRVVTIELNDEAIFIDGKPGMNDKVTVLAIKKDATYTADIIETTFKFPVKKVSVLGTTAEQPVAKPPEEKPAPVVAQPKPASPKPKPVEQAAPPAAPAKTITITTIESLPPNKYKVSWASNFESPLGYKLVWSLSPNPTYPGSDNYYDSGSLGWGYVKNTLGPGTYYVRVCEKTDTGCDTYSNQITVTFAP